ncbi:MAG: flagellar assembly protein FliW [Planctomycetaceae bacterium]|nr:flagellar assembly protein FliW [Planctomycetaceae bacterium]
MATCDDSGRGEPASWADRRDDPEDVSGSILDRSICRRAGPWRRPARRHWREQEVNIVTTRFGLIQVLESDLIWIPDGLVGFRSFTQYVHFPDPVVTGLSWLQCVTAPELAFGLIAPPLAISDYRLELRPGDRAALELDEQRSALVYVILNRGEGGGLTVNLQGPLVFNPVRRLGRQLVLTSSRYAVRYPLDPHQVHAPNLLPGPSPLRATA